jgi:hypothetical protein
VDLAGAIDTAFNQTGLAGDWDDGVGTTVDLGVSIAPGQICAEPIGDYTVVVVPVDVVANSADNRVASLSGRGTVRATVAAGVLSQLQLWLSTDLICGSTTELLAYRTVDCSQVSSVTAQLGANRYQSGNDQGRLELYVYQRNSNASPGAADRVDRLNWTF